MKTTFREPLSEEEKQEHNATLGSGEPAVYCGTYGKYNNGDLYGQWIAIDSFDDHDEFIEYCKRLHADEEDPELMMQDYGYYPESWYYESGMSEKTFDKIKEYASVDENLRDAYETYLENFNSDATFDEFEENYKGEWSNPDDFAEDLCEQAGDLENIPDWIRSCIDWSAVWRNLETGGDYTECNGYIFSNY